MSLELIICEIQIPVPWGYVAAKTYGDSTRRPILVIHDWLDNAASFDKLIPLLSDRFYFVAIDLPGHGKSSHLEKGIGYHLVDFIPVLNRIISHFKWKNICLLGHGIGAGLAVLYATVYSTGPQKVVERLILLNSIKPPSVETEGGAPIIAAAIKELLDLEINVPEESALTFQECTESLIAEGGGKHSEEVAKILLTRGGIQLEDSEGKWALTRDCRLKIPDTLRFTHDQCFNVLRSIEIPVLAIMTPPDSSKIESNQREQDIYKKSLEIYNETNRSFRLIEVEGNHYIHVNEPENIINYISEFLRGYSLRGYF